MSVVIAEYLGRRTDKLDITPVRISKNGGSIEKPTLPCPFRNGHCSKAKKGEKPVCSVRDTANNDTLWIVCPNRLCASSPKDSLLNDHQRSILHMVAKKIYGEEIPEEDILVKREVPIRVTEDNSYSADYVMWRKNPIHRNPFNPDRAVVLEMQGGGETTNTGKLTEHIDDWDRQGVINNQLLNTPIREVSPLVTNAWRRQQEQFLVKGNVSMLTGGKMVFCVGSMLFDYLMNRFREGILTDLKDANWTLALLTFEEDKTQGASAAVDGAIPLKISEEKILYTNYNSFVQVLTNQAQASTSLFTGEYIDFLGAKTLVNA